MEKKIKKYYYTIGEVSNLLELKPYILRYWEKEFPQLKPHKKLGGNRRYNPDDIAHELAHALEMPLIESNPAWIEGQAVYFKALVTGQWINGDYLGESSIQYDESNSPLLRERGWSVDADLYRIAGEAVYQIEQECPGFLKSIQSTYNDLIEKGKVKSGEALSFEEFESLVSQAYPEGGWEAFSRHYIFLNN